MLARAAVLAHGRVAGPEVLVTACSRLSSQASGADAAALPAPCDRDAGCDASSSRRSFLASSTADAFRQHLGTCNSQLTRSCSGQHIHQQRTWALGSAFTTPSCSPSHAATFATAAPRASASTPGPPRTSSPASQPPSPTPAATAPEPDATASSSSAPPDPLSGLDMESLMRAIVHPLSLGRVRNPALLESVLQLDEQSYYFDPSQTLTSTMRALHLVRRVLRSGGHVLVVNPNPNMRPLLRDAAHMCINSNVWFWYHDWEPGALTASHLGGTVFSERRQPNRKLLAMAGRSLANPLCPGGAAGQQAVRPLPRDDLQRLVGGIKRGRERAEKRATLMQLQAAAVAGARLPLPGPPSTSDSRELSLVVVLDLSYGGDAVREAYERNVPTVSLLNAHSDTSLVTYPVYASEAHVGYQHFFLDWLLRVVNVRAGR